MTKSKKNAYELPTPELTAKAEFREEALNAAPGAPKRLRRMDSTELDRLLFAGDIMPDEHCTLELFRKDLMEAGLVFMPKAGMNPSSTSGGGHFIADAAFRRVARVRDQMTAIQSLGQGHVSLILSAIREDRRVPKADVAVMQQAARLLEPYYRR